MLLRFCALIPISLLLAISATAQENEFEPLTSGTYELTFHKVDDGVWMGERPNYWRVPIIGNIIIIEGDQSVVLFDGGGSHQTAVQILDFVKTTTAKPISHLVLSHWHNDHTIGIDRIKAAFPGMEIIAHQFTTDYLRDQLAPRIADGGENIENLLRDVSKELETGIDYMGNPMSIEARAEAQQILADQNELREAFYDQNTLTPDTSITDHMTIDLGSKTLELKYMGFGNTAGDLVGWIPEQKILMTGDIFTHPVPFGFPFEPRKTVETMKRVLKHDFEKMIFGHGDVQMDSIYANKVINLIARVNSNVDKLVAQGKSLDEAKEAIDLTRAQAEFADGDPWISYRFYTWFIGPMVQRSYTEIAPTEEEG